MPVLRIATIQYEHVPLNVSPQGGTIGNQVDEQIRKHIGGDGRMPGLLHEVTVSFEENEWSQLEPMYEPKGKTARVV